MDDNRSSRDRNAKELRYESDDSNCPGGNADNEQIIEDKGKARFLPTPVKLPNCRCDTPPVIDGEKPGPSGLQPPVNRFLPKRDILYSMCHRPNGKLPAVEADYYWSSSDSEDEDLYSRDRSKKKQKIQGFMYEEETAHSSTDPRFSDSYDDQQSNDGLSKGQASEPQEPEWPKDVPIHKGDILYMMFQRPSNDKEAKPAPEKAENPMKRSARESVATVGRTNANGEQVIKKFKEDIENDQSYSPDVRLSNSCFEQEQIIEELPIRSRSDLTIAASELDPEYLDLLFHGPPNAANARPSASPDVDLFFRVTPSSSNDAHWYLRNLSSGVSFNPYSARNSSQLSLNPHIARNSSQISIKNERCSNGYIILPEWPSRKDMVVKKPTTTNGNRHPFPFSNRNPENDVVVRKHRKRKHCLDKNDIIIKNESTEHLSNSDNSESSSKRRREEIESDSSSDYEELEETPPTPVELPQADPESLIYFQRLNTSQEPGVYENNYRYDGYYKRSRYLRPRLPIRHRSRFN